MRKIILLLITLNLLSCKNDTEEIIQYDKNGNILSKNYVSQGKFLDSVIYLENGLIDSKMIFKKNSKTECYVKYFDKNGILESEGNTINKKKIGKWRYYNPKSEVRKIVEFKNICTDEYANQEWNYLQNGKLNPNLCTYFTYKIGESTIMDGVKVNNLKIYYSPMSKKGVICTINLSQKIIKDFCNVDLVEKFTLRSDDKFTFTIPINSEDLKEKSNIRGYIEEHLFEEDTKNKKMLNHKSRRVYIDIPIYIN